MGGWMDGLGVLCLKFHSIKAILGFYIEIVILIGISTTILGHLIKKKLRVFQASNSFPKIT